MLDRWQVLRSDPDRYTHPDELAELWSEATSVQAPTTVGGFAGQEDIDDFDWWQRCLFDVTEASTIEFRGLTFPASVFLDGRHVADCESMFLPVRIDCEPGAHDVSVRFGSLNRWLTTRRPRGRWRSSLVSAPGLRWARTTLLGRAPVYGNIPAPVGLWRPAILSTSRLHLSFTVTADAVTGHVELTGATAAPDGTPIDVQLRGPAGATVTTHPTVAQGGRFGVTGRVDDPQRWWPHGYGPQPLYRAGVCVDGGPARERVFGFRTVGVSTEDSGFRIDVNGVRLFCRGATWSPPDALHLNVSEAVMRDHLSTFVAAGANMVRVVGGLVYEQDEFWDCCAELGLMVWQDAMQATFDPSDEVSELITREVTHLLQAVSGNPALTVISGGSETLQQPEMLGLDAANTTMAVIDTLLPKAVTEHSDAVYVKASPAPPADSDDLAIRPDTGIAHWFGVGGYLRPIADVRSAAVKFAAECLAFANPPSPEGVQRYFGSAAVAGHDPIWKAGVPRDRGSSWDFEDVRDFYARAVFGEDLLSVRRVDPERYLQLGRLAIAEAMHECFAFWRRRESGCSGALVLAGKDLRPGAGWGLLDVDGAPKPALDVLTRVWSPVAVILADDGLAGIRIDVHNDTPTPLTGRLRLTATNVGGATAVDVTRDVIVSAHSSVTYADAKLSGVFRDLNHAFGFGLPTADAVEAEVQFDGSQAAVRDVLVVTPRTGQARTGLEAVAHLRSDDVCDLRISCDVALRYVCIESPGWRSSDNAFHLAAGCPYIIRLTRTNADARLAGTVSSIDASAGVPILTAQ